jgi:hypothetical protein
MKILVTVGLSFIFFLTACSRPNPLEEMVSAKNIRVTWLAFGEAYLPSCDKKDKSFSAKLCSQEIKQAVKFAFNSGYKELKVSDFNDELIARYLNNLKADSLAMSKKTASKKLIMDW